ncbi:hypothetical protein [Burkholderia cepacia]|uniref:hypothetical protein n=1 Tax=Burkholderia cepacia TaxID=292 RepID=UPI001CF266BB|nr:hypothetical protein [Burkholderia cepacia]MCA8075580.1 hypothetical protein [Burkholderia cepacia]
MVKMMSVYAIVKGSVVTNMIVWDGNVTRWSPPKGDIAVEVTTETGVAAIGYSWNGTSFAAPIPSTEPTTELTNGGGSPDKSGLSSPELGNALDASIDRELQPAADPAPAATPTQLPKLLGQIKRSAGSN